MATERTRVLIRQFLGLGLSGEAASQPVRQVSGGEFAAFCAEGTQNVHTPAGNITNRGVGYLNQAAKPANATTWDFLAYMLRSDGNGYQVGISNGLLFDQGQLTNSWTEYGDFTGLASTGWSAAKLWDWLFLANGTDTPMVFFGGAEPRAWLIAAPTTPPSAAEVPTGTLDSSAGWTYKYAYRRSTGADAGWMSPLSAESPEQIDAADNDHVDVTVAGTADPTIDKIDIFRSVGGGLYRFLTTVNNPGATTTVYSDYAADADLSIVEATTQAAIDPFQFQLMTVHGDSLWVAQIVEDGITRLGRVRVSYPGQPWRFDDFDFTDEIDAPITALVSVDDGVLAFTPDSLYKMRWLGGGALAVDKTDEPGTPNRYTASAVRGGAAWLSGRNVWLRIGDQAAIISDPTGRSVFTQERIAGSSVEPLLRDLANLSGVWVGYHHGLNYVLVGYSASRFLAYDMERSAWWMFTYGCGPGDAVQVAVVADDRELSGMLFARPDGSLATIFSGRTADGGDLQAVLRVGASSYFIAHRKRFRYIEYAYDTETDLDLDARWEINRGKIAVASQVISIEAAGDELNSTFVLDQSRMGAEARELSRHPVHRSGEYFTFELASRGQGLLDLAAAEVAFQAKRV